MEEWNDGIMEEWISISIRPNIPAFQYSNIPG